jgi:hypothetical protein
MASPMAFFRSIPARRRQCKPNGFAPGLDDETSGFLEGNCMREYGPVNGHLSVAIWTLPLSGKDIKRKRDHTARPRN